MSVNSQGAVSEPLVTFGVLTDVQYADCDDRPASYNTSKTRFYRRSLNQVDAAFKFWSDYRLGVKFVLQLGDIIDGLSRSFGGSHTSMCSILSHFENHRSLPTFHTVGNHELYNFNRKELAQLFYDSMMKLSLSPEVFSPLEPVQDKSPLLTPVLYYKFSPVPSLKVISLDCFDISVLGYDEQHPNFQEASRILTSKHGHDVFEDWDCNGALEGLDVRFQQMNGAVGKVQLIWLENELKESDELGQKVIVFGHISLYPDSTDWSCLLWNYDEVISIFHQHKCVVAYFSGHSHQSGYGQDSHGINYVVFKGIIETPPDSSAFATVSVYQNHLEIHGHGEENSYIFSFENSTGSSSNDVSVDNDVAISPAVKVEV